MSNRLALGSSGGIAHALRLEQITIVWMVIEAAGSVVSGVIAASTLLLAFGIDSLVELISAVVLYHRLKAEAVLGPTERVAQTEKRAGIIGGYLLFGLALYVAATSIWKLYHHGAATESIPGILIAAVAAFGMPSLARAKVRAADEIGSRALRADAMETFTCGYLSWVLLAGLVANAAFHLWWLDGVAALILVPFLLKEGKEAITGECGCQKEVCAS